MTNLAFITVLIISLFSLAFSQQYNDEINKLTTKKLNPVILIPGLEGSRMEAKLNRASALKFCRRKTSWYDVWINPEEFLPGVIDCWIDDFLLFYDKQTGLTANQEGVSTRPKAFGRTDGVEYLTAIYHVGAYFHPLIETFVKLGYTRNLNIRAAPYDFRRSPNDLESYFDDLRALIESNYADNNNQANYMICHSMGCMFSLYFLNSQSQQWKSQYVKELISLAGPWSGAVGATSALAQGPSINLYIYKEQKLRPLARSFSSSYFLMPNKGFNDQPFARINGKNYTYANTQELLSLFKIKNAEDMWQNSKDLISDLDHPQVNVTCIYGKNVGTMEFLDYANPKDFPDNPKVVNGDGDGTVNMVSLEGCLRWAGDDNYGFRNKVFDKVNHGGTVKDKNVLDYISNLIVGAHDDEWVEL